MDLRQRKSRAAIYRALGECLHEKDFADLSVENILEKANVSRSTFYAHFRTKDDVLDSLITNIFHHVFSHSLHQEDTHDFSHESVLDYEHLFTHVLYHLRDERELIDVVLKGSCKERILAELRQNIEPLIARCVNEGAIKPKDVPTALRTKQATESFVSLVTYWFECGCDVSPEECTRRFFSLI